MNRRAFLLLVSGACAAVVVPIARGAVELPTSTLIVYILSVERESVSYQELQDPVSRRNVFAEVTSFIAKVEIRQVLESGHGLTPGSNIDVKYNVTAFPEMISKSLEPGQTVTLTVFRSRDGTSFGWRQF